jgi:hypothetical protein
LIEFPHDCGCGPKSADPEAIEGDLRLASPKTQRLEAAPVLFNGQSVACWERVMDEPLVVVQEPMNGADLYQKLAAEHSDLMKDASSPFLESPLGSVTLNPGAATRCYDLWHPERQKNNGCGRSV